MKISKFFNEVLKNILKRAFKHAPKRIRQKVLTNVPMPFFAMARFDLTSYWRAVHAGRIEEL